MKQENFEYKVLVRVSFTEADLDIMEQCASNHYDGKCKNLVQQGGTVYGMRNMLTLCRPDKAEATLSFRDLDTIAKCLEQANLIKANWTEASDLAWAIRGMLSSINERWGELDASSVTKDR